MTELTAEMVTSLEQAVRDWLPGQRFYAGKGQQLDHVAVVVGEPVAPLSSGGELRWAVATLTHASTHVVDLTTTADDAEDHETVHRYQVPLSLRPQPVEALEHAAVAHEPAGAQLHVYDAVQDPEAMAAVLALLRDSDTAHGVAFASTEVGRSELSAAHPHGLDAHLLGAEQSNTSVVFGDTAIMKVFRRLAPGANPDVELTGALTEGGSPHIAPLFGSATADVDGESTTLLFLQRFLPDGTDGWKLATASVRDLYAEADLHPEECGGDFAGEAERLGEATAEVHALLAQVLPSGIAPDGDAQATADRMIRRLTAAVQVAPNLGEYAPALTDVYQRLAATTDPVPIQRVHGDYHLGQVLRTTEGWVLLDFEGEPARPLSERTLAMSPLRDVAGMLRSFDYAARALLADRQPGVGGLAYRAQEWAERNRNAFCDGYAAGSGRDPRADQVLLRAFELDKAVYEVVYEARHRPSWLAIPLGSVRRLVETATA